METLNFTPEEHDIFVKDQNTVHMKSKYGFLNAHNGLRRGSTHVLMGTAGGGKSTLVRSVLRDFIFNKENTDLGVVLHLSEESCLEYKGQLIHSVPSHEQLDRGALISEEEHPDEDFDYFLERHRVLAPDLLIYDNMTTSRFYEGTSVKAQAKIFSKIKALTKELNCATLIVAHTKADISDGMDRFINMNDIRGSKAIPNMAEFFYILQRFKVEDDFFPTLRILKSRSQQLIHSMYYLQYEKSTRSYVKDSAISFDQFKEAYTKRQRLPK